MPRIKANHVSLSSARPPSWPASNCACNRDPPLIAPQGEGEPTVRPGTLVGLRAAGRLLPGSWSRRSSSVAPHQLGRLVLVTPGCSIGKAQAGATVGSSRRRLLPRVDLRVIFSLVESHEMGATVPSHPRLFGGCPPAAPRTRAGLVAAAVVLALVSALSGCSSNSTRTTITFFQFKGEAQQYFRDLSAKFERANPGIKVVVDNPADPETALRTRLVKDRVPDVMTLNANGTFGEFASAKIFRDFRRDPVLGA